MRVGVKYCGGCREQYDRGAAAERIRSAFSDTKVVFVYAEPGGSYDAMLVFYGCGTKCADISGYRAGKVVIVDSDESAGKAEQDLLSIYKEGLC